MHVRVQIFYETPNWSAALRHDPLCRISPASFHRYERYKGMYRSFKTFLNKLGPSFARFLQNSHLPENIFQRIILPDFMFHFSC